jgi:hypothetical protein
MVDIREKFLRGLKGLRKASGGWVKLAECVPPGLKPASILLA